MPFPSAKRVAALAVRRFGADPGRVDRLLESGPRGDASSADPVKLLLDQGVLSQHQAGELREMLESALPVAEFHPGEFDTPGDDPPTMVDVKTHVPDVTATDVILPAVPVETLQAIGGFRVIRRLGEGSM